jgi:hypothetical protein
VKQDKAKIHTMPPVLAEVAGVLERNHTESQKYVKHAQRFHEE